MGAGENDRRTAVAMRALADAGADEALAAIPAGSFIAKFEQPEFTGLSLWDGHEVHVVLSGCADIGTRDCLRQLLTEAHAAARAWGAKGVVLWLRKTRFLNSSCISAIIGWANAVEQQPADDRYTIKVLWDPQMG